MPAIYMTHAEHGATFVYNEEDAARHEKLGWRKNDLRKMIEPEESVLTDAPQLSDYETLAAQYEAKFGKPPHHRMKQATIKAHLRE